MKFDPLWRGLSGIALCAAFCVPARAGDVVYTYIGNAFNSFPNGPACPPICNISGDFTVAAALPANMPLTLVPTVSFSLTSGLTTLTASNSDPTNTQLLVGTDATGAINTWSWQAVGPTPTPTTRMVTQNESGSAFDDIRIGSAPPPFVGPIVGIIQNDPGTWTASPEPGTQSILGVGLLVIWFAARRLRRRTVLAPAVITGTARLQ